MKILNILLLPCLFALSAPAFADLNVFACEPHWASLVTEIGGSHVDVTTASGAFNDPHFILARPSLISRLRRADLVVCNGADLEVGWLPVLLQQASNDRIQPGQPGYLDASHEVQLLQVPTRVDRAMGDIHPYGNPHFQTDPHNIVAVATELVNRMVQLDPGNAAFYQQHYQDFSARFSAAIARWEQEAAPLKGMKLVAYHDGWVYLSHWLGLDIVGFLEPKPGIPPSPAHLSELLNQMKGTGVQGIIYTPYEDEQAPEWLSQRTGVPTALIPDTVGADNDQDLFQFYDLMVNQLLKLHGEAK